VATEGSKDSKQPTMGLDSLYTDGPTKETLATIRHEILHSVGFEHEHQRPDARCEFKSFRQIQALLSRKESSAVYPRIYSFGK